MDLLPDDVVAQVMYHLSLPDLFHMRLVCKRFAALARHFDVWRLKSLITPNESLLLGTPDHADADHWFCRALRLAPCLDSMEVWLPTASSECHLLFVAPCAARRLTVHIEGGAGAMHAALLIRHQKDLGRLKRVVVEFEDEGVYDKVHVSKEDVSMLFGALVFTPGLDSLSIGGASIDDYLPARSKPAFLRSTGFTASLTRISLHLVPALQLVFNYLLSGHAATLEAVRLWAYDITMWTPPPSVALLLAGMPRLASLHCPMLDGMDALATCKSLRTMHLVHNHVLSFAPATALFFRRALRLQEVHLVFMEVELAVELVTALASSGRSRVESLCIHNADKPSPQQMQELLGALPALPALRRLRVAVVDQDDARALLAAHPSLHVEVGEKCLSK